ncbi:hypothetical protein ABT025_18620 [Streptomyces sp. NPDC002809]|uniref:hypothetical protein n=1 Tax=Streptomyces sp. NPDC002809 TaxID=3154433 RepID=UPI0033178DE7
MTETVEDRDRRYLVPVARLNLPDQPDEIHLSVYRWLPEFDAWATGMAICGCSTQQGPLPKATVTCPECVAYRPRYERMLAPGYRPEDDDPDMLRERAERAERQVEQAKVLAMKWHEAAAVKSDAVILAGVAGDVLLAALNGHLGPAGEVDR